MQQLIYKQNYLRNTLAFYAGDRTKKLAAFTACVALFFDQINYLAHTIMKFLGLVNAYTTVTLLGIYLLLTLYSLLMNLDKNKLLRASLFVVVLSALYGISILSYRDNAQFISQSIAEKLFLYGLPTYLLFSVQENFDDMMKFFSKFCLLSIFTQTIAIVNSVFFLRFFVETDYQGISYGLLIPLTYYVCKSNRRARDYLLIAFMMVLLFLFGGRGPIVCSLCCILFRLLLNIRKNKVWILTTGAIIVLFSTFYQSVLDMIIKVSENYGFSGSLMKYYNMGDIFSDSGRNDIYDISSRVIRSFPLTGCGLGGDRYWLGEFGYKYGVYPHNFFIEILIQFGLVVGTALLIWFLVRVFRCFFNKKKESSGYLLFSLLFFSNGFLGLMFSSSYLLSVSFFAMLATMGYLLKRKGGDKNEKNRNLNLS